MPRHLFIVISLLFFAFFSFGQKSKNYLVAYTDSSSGQELIGYKTAGGALVIKAKYTSAPSKFITMATVSNTQFEFVCIDQNDSIILIPYIYDNGPDYIEEGLFRFVENDKIGFANKDGQKIIPAKYDFATPFNEGLSAYTLGGHLAYEKGGEHTYWTAGVENGFVNKLGQEFTRINELTRNKRQAWTKDKKHFVLNKSGQIIKVLTK